MKKISKLTTTQSCYQCGAQLCKDDIALNLKLIHRDLTRFLCCNCLGEEMELSQDYLQALVERFREEGCALFR